MTLVQKIEAVSSMIDSVWEDDSFQEMLTNAPLLTASGERRDRLLDAATASATPDQKEELKDAILGENNDYLTVGILYGLQPADAIRYVSTHPAEYSAHILARIRERSPGLYVEEMKP